MLFHGRTELHYNEPHMEEQLTLRLRADLSAQLNEMARRLGRKRSEVARLAIAHFVASPVEHRPIELVRDLLGKVKSGKSDLGQNHRAYLIKRLRNAR